MHSISDLTTYCRKTTGDIPAKLVGASTTVVGSKMYLFGGRLVLERKMVSDLYAFDLETFRWELIEPHPGDDIPLARYFHSADTWNNKLVIFGGMSNREDSLAAEDLCVLNDVRIFDLASKRWIPSASTNPVLSDPGPDPFVPKARYAHLSSVTANRLFIIGGQDLSNVWLDDIYVYDLVDRKWVQRREYPRHCGTYRSVAVSAEQCVQMPTGDSRTSQSTLGTPGTRFKTNKTAPASPDFTPSESLVYLPYSAPPSKEHPSDIFLYSNYNFTDVKRELEVFSPLPDNDFAIQDRSSAMRGAGFPPGLRFPTGAILGTYFIIAGTYLAHTYQSFSIWALDLVNMTWLRIDPGSAVASGSWFRGCLWAASNKFLIFGNRNGNLVDDYNRRLLSWDHVAVIDLEAFGIYQPPPLKLDIPMQELGLAALEEGVLTDFEILCEDDRKIKCSRKVLEDRWPWFKEQRQKFLAKANHALDTLPASAMHAPLPSLTGTIAFPAEARPDPRLTPRSFLLSEPYPITMALLQYFYTLALLTPLQQTPAVLSQLLVLSSTYEITHLQSLVKHAMHRSLSNSTSVGVYEVATLCSCRSLQIRALKTVMSYSQKGRSSRTRTDRDGGAGGSRGPDAGGSRNNGIGFDAASTTRPRGTSDAHWRPHSEQQNGAAGMSRGYTHPGSAGNSYPVRSRPLTVILERSSSSASEYSSQAHSSQSHSSTSTTNQIGHGHDHRATNITSMNNSCDLFPADKDFNFIPESTPSPGISRKHDSHPVGERHRGTLSDDLNSAASLLRRPSTSPPSFGPPRSQSPSLYSESEHEQSSDDQQSGPFGSFGRTSPYPAFHLPLRARQRHTSDCDASSSRSADSFSSLASTSWSQRQPISPPDSPIVLTETIKKAMVAPHLAIVSDGYMDDDEWDTSSVEFAAVSMISEFGDRDSDEDGSREGDVEGDEGWEITAAPAAATAEPGTSPPRPAWFRDSILEAETSSRPKVLRKRSSVPRMSSNPTRTHIRRPSLEGVDYKVPTNGASVGSAHIRPTSSRSRPGTATTTDTTSSSTAVLGRLFKKAEKPPVRSEGEMLHWMKTQPNPANEKARKALEKRRKKADARERIERLALELKMRQEARESMGNTSVGSLRSERSQNDIPNMWGGLTL